MLKIPNAELWRQITREGRRWGLVPMLSPYGEVLVAEEFRLPIPLGCGISVMETVQRDITSVSRDYPFAYILRNRKGKAERSFATRREIALAMQAKDRQQFIADAEHELAHDMRQADKGRIIIGG